MNLNYRKAIINFCMACKKNDAFAVGQCTTYDCPLHLVRPNRSLVGKPIEEFTPDRYEQQVMDQLNLHSLERTIDGTERD